MERPEMKKLALLVVLSVPGCLQAQSTTVSGTITDLGSQTWKNGTYDFQFIPNPQHPGGPYTWTGGPLTPNISGLLSDIGTYSVSVPSNTAISPSGSSWAITFCPLATAHCYAMGNVTITGATQTLNV